MKGKWNEKLEKPKTSIFLKHYTQKNKSAFAWTLILYKTKTQSFFSFLFFFPHIMLYQKPSLPLPPLLLQNASHTHNNNNNNNGNRNNDNEDSRSLGKGANWKRNPKTQKPSVLLHQNSTPKNQTHPKTKPRLFSSIKAPHSKKELPNPCKNYSTLETTSASSSSSFFFIFFPFAYSSSSWAKFIK